MSMLNNISYLGISLQSFALFSEYFLGISIIFILIAATFATKNVHDLMIQKALSQSIALVLFMACYLMINDDIIAFETVNSFNSSYKMPTERANLVSFHGSIINDYLGFCTKFIVCLSSAIYFMLIADSLKEQRLIAFEYLLITLFAVLGLMLLCNSNDFLMAYLAMELSSLASYALAAFRKDSSYSVESGIKYFIAGSISSAFFLLGSSFVFGYTASINFTDLSKLIGHNGFFLTDHFILLTEMTKYLGREDDVPHSWFLLILIYGKDVTFDCEAMFVECNIILEVGFALICLSLFIKLALAPFHLWSLDVYENSPTSASFFFAVIGKLSFFVLLVRICYQAYPHTSGSWQFYSLLVGLCSVFVGCLGGLKQRKLKTLLAYSSTTQMGYAIIAFSVNSHQAVHMMFFSLIVYIIGGLSTWYIISLLRVKRLRDSDEKYSKELGDLLLLSKSNPSLAIALSISMFSISGIPPLAGFISKMNLFLPVLGSSNYSIFIAVALTSFLLSVISTFYYIRIIKVLYFENGLVGRLYHPINSNQTLTLSVLIFLLLFIFINPTFLYLLTYKIQFSFI